MNIEQAKQILLTYRPNGEDAEDPEMQEAVTLMEREPELARWFAESRRLHDEVRARFRAIQPPAELKPALLVAQSKIIALPAPRFDWKWRAAAAALVFFLGLVTTWLLFKSPDEFSQFRERMVSTALREYRMDIVTNDLAPLRRYMATGGAPADFEVTKGLSLLQLTGGGLIRWQDHPVGMVCFNRGNDQMLFLFVLRRHAIKEVPSETPQFATIHELATVSWSHGDKTYVLAGPAEPGFVKKYL